MDTEEKPCGDRQRREGGGHQPRDRRPEPPEAGRGGKDPPLEPLQGAWPWDPCRASGLQGWVGGWMSVVTSPPVCGPLSGQPRTSPKLLI